MDYLDVENLFEGMTVMALFRQAPDTATWSHFIPVYIEKEYPRFFVCTVLPHRNKGAKACGLSSPYPMTIDKFNMKRREVLVKRYLGD